MILVVGGAGYIGSHVCLALKEAGFEPLIFDNLSRGHQELVFGRLVEGDLLDKEALKKAFDLGPIEGVMHFAAKSLVGESVSEPAGYYANNVAGVINLLDVMLEKGVKNFVFSSSAAVYGEPKEVPILESALLAPKNPYGETKRITESLCDAYCAAYGLKATTLRYFNAAGADAKLRTGEDHTPETHIIPLALQAAAEGKEFKLFGDDYPTADGTCVRDYVHVTDLADAHLRAFDALVKAPQGTRKAYNLGSGSGYSNLEILKSVGRVTGRPLAYQVCPRRAGDPATLVASSRKAQEELGWQRRYDDLDEIITTAWNWGKKRFGWA